MFKYFTLLFCLMSVVVFTGCEVAEKNPSGSVVYFRNIVAEAEALNVAGYAPATEGKDNIACIKNGTKAEAKLKIKAKARFADNALIRNTKLLVKSVDAVFTKNGAPVPASHILTTVDNVSIGFDQSSDMTVTIRNINSQPDSIPADAIYKYTLTFDVVGIERLFGQSDYTGIFTALWGDILIVGKDVVCSEAIKK